MKHEAVLKSEAIDLLNVKPDGVYLDLTLGRAGHASEILKRLNKNGRLIAFDLDDEAIKESEQILKKIGGNYDIIHSNFRYFPEFLKLKGIKEIDGIIMDLGVSSPQFEEDYRGFSYQRKGNLDMRMDRRQKITAKYIVNNYSLNELTRVFREYGEDPDAFKIAKKIIKYREKNQFISTIELADLVAKVKMNRHHHRKGHPAKQIFQALRIEVNDELNNLKIGLDCALKCLKSNGRLVIISFHSLEDRIIKRTFNKVSKVIGNREDDYKMPTANKVEFKLITSKPITPSEEELMRNHRSHSAKLRAIEKL